MTGHFSERTRWMIVAAFAIAMAWVESASVFYIRALVGRIEPYQADPLPINGALGYVELWREAATLVMIATLGMLAGRTWLRRAGYAALAFGIWDIFYYVFLRVMIGLAEDAAGLGHPVPAAAAMVGTGARAGQHRGADDRMGHPRDAVGSGDRRPLAVGARLGRYRRWRSPSSCSTPGRRCRPDGRQFCGCCRRRSTGRRSGWPCC